jgi:phosphatidylglycerophosphate synthase
VWLRPHDPAFLCGIMLLAGVTDVLDGRLGRRLHGTLTGTANIGAWLDPLCDKVFAASAAAAIWVAYRPPAGVVVLVLLRELALLVLMPAFRLAGGRARFHAHDYRARLAGKATTAAQFAALLAVVFAPGLAFPLAWLAAVLGVCALAEYAVLAARGGRRSAGTSP